MPGSDRGVLLCNAMASWLLRWGSIALVTSGTILGTSGAAFGQSDTERAGARAAAEAGLSAYKSGRYAEALDLLNRAESIVHALPHLLYMARSAEKLGRLVQARELYLKIGREQLIAGAPRAFVEAQQAATQELAGIDARLPYLTVNVEGARANDVKITLDDREIPAVLIGVPFPVDPGSHVLVMTSALGQKTASATVVLAESKRERVVLKATSAGTGAASPIASTSTAPSDTSAPGASSNQPPQPALTAGTARDVTLDGNSTTGSKGVSPLLTYGALGLGVVGAAVGTIFIVQRGSKQSDADKAFEDCKSRFCSAAEQDEFGRLDKSAATAGTISLVGFGVGAAALATGIYLLVTGDPQKSTALVTPRFSPLIGPSYAGATVRF